MKQSSKKTLYLMIGIFFIAAIALVNFQATTFSQTGFELMEGIGGWQIYDPFKRTYGYTGDMYTTDEQACSGNYSLKFRTPTSYFAEQDGVYYVSTVALALFFANPLAEETTDIVYTYEVGGIEYEEVFPTLQAIEKDDLIINPMFECAFWGMDNVNIRIDITAWDYDGTPIGRGLGALVNLDPYGSWLYYRQNIVDAVNSEIGSNWLGLRSIELRLYDEQAILQHDTYAYNPLEMYIDDFKFYSGDPDSTIDYEQYGGSMPFMFESILIGIFAIILVKKITKKEEDE